MKRLSSRSRNAFPTRLAIHLVATCWMGISVTDAVSSPQTPSDPSIGSTQIRQDGLGGDTSNEQAIETESATASNMVPLGITPAGVQRHISGKWATLAVNGVNNENVDAEETILFSIKGSDGDQVSRKLWIPAGARRQAWFPILIPETSPDQLQVTAQTIQLAQSDSGETFQANRVGSPTSERSLLLSPPEDGQAAMMIDSIFSVDSGTLNVGSLTDMLYAGFDSATNIKQDLGMSRFASHFLPTTANPLDSLDVLIIGSDQLVHDTVGISRLRQWLNDGGRIWLMADLVSPESVNQLLGDSVNFSVLERVELNEFSIEKLDPFFATVSLEEKWESETPVDFVRVMIKDGEIHSRIDGWPTAIWIPAGNGEILVTTLGHEGWMINGNPTETYRDLASRFFVEREVAFDHKELLVTELNREIGYRIPSRNLIAYLLGGHFLVLGVVGIYLTRHKSLHQLGWFLPLSVALSVMLLLIIGGNNTSAVPSTIAVGQFAKAVPETSQLQIDTSIAVYSQSPTEIPLSTNSDIVTLIDSDWDASGPRRQQFNDNGISDWRFLKQPPGKIQHLHLATRQSMKTPWQVRGSFDESGFYGSLIGLDPSQSTDAVVVSASSPSMTIKIESDENRLSGTKDQILLADQFYDGSFLTDTQRTRQTFIRNLSNKDESFTPQTPSLLVWTQPITAGLEIPSDFVQRGWALALCPISITPPKSGTTFTIPSSFIKVDSYRGERGISTLYDADTGKWLESVDKPAEVDLRIQIPSAVAPCNLSACEISIHANAPGRTIQFHGYTPEGKTLLHEIKDAQGLNVFSITEAQALQLDSKAGFRLTVEVTVTDQEETANQEIANQQVGSQQGTDTQTDPNDIEYETKALEESKITWGIKYLNVSVQGSPQT